jgi:uncharacterized protein YndB with AHSA1/START domain
MADRIEREVELRAPIERVWQVITDPAYVARWFGGKAQIDLRPGGAAVFGWPEEGMGDFHAVVERVDPPRLFAFRWTHDAGVPVGAAAVSTLVEFTLSPEGDGTRLRLVESGFTDETHRKENSEGWDAELADLAALLADT